MAYPDTFVQPHPFEITEFTALDDDQVQRALQPDGKLHLFSCFVCPYAHRALWTAAEVDAAIDNVVEVDLMHYPDRYDILVNRHGTVPFLVDDGFHVYESAVIAQYLDTKYGHGKLHRRGLAMEESLVALVISTFDSSSLRQFAIEKNEDDQGVLTHLAVLEHLYGENASSYRSKGPFLLGDELSAADIHILPFFFRYELFLAHFKKYDLVAKFPLLKAALVAAKARPAFQRTVREDAYYIAGYASLFGST